MNNQLTQLNSTLAIWSQALLEDSEVSDATKATYRQGMRKFLEWCNKNKIEKVTPAVIRKWKADLLHDKKPSTVNTWLAGVRYFYRQAVETGQLRDNPTLGIDGARRKGSKRHKRQAFTDAEIRRILAGPDQATTMGKRDYALLMLKSYCAIRDVEIHRADLTDLTTQDNQVLLFVQGKGSTEKDEPKVVPPMAADALYSWLAARGPEAGPLFTSLSDRSFAGRLGMSTIRHLVLGYIRLAGVVDPRKTSHSFRHTAITSAIRHGAAIQKVSAMAGHLSLDVTGQYYHEVDRLTDPAELYVGYDEK